MSFKRGSKVEVFCKKDTPCGSWRLGEIVSGNRRYYDIRYEMALGATDQPSVQRVSKKVIRPLPPKVYIFRDLVPGDIVEVFQSMFWKVAIVSKVNGGNYCLVRLVGSSQEVRAHKSEVRVRQILRDDEWVMVRKGLGVCEDGKSDSMCYQKSTRKVARTGGKRKLNEEDDFSFQNNIGFQESHMVSSRSLKRGSPNGLSYLEPCTRAGQNMRAIEKEGSRQRMAAEHPYLLPEKVDAVASPPYMLGEKRMHASFYNQIYETDAERAEASKDVGCFSGRSLESSDAESSTCSVGSCSINSNSPYRLPYCSSTNRRYDLDSHSSDAESFCGRGYEKKCSLPSKEDVAAEIHKLELHGYHRTMGALYCSGPLSWEQEELLTNLRLMLHISNDEHLMELRNLFSGQTNLMTS